jgi:hAT family C-terminal dimerisation region
MPSENKASISLTTSQHAPSRLKQRLAGIRQSSTSALDEYDRYILEPVHETPNEDFDPLNWWLEPSQQERFPRLSKMGLDLLSAPAMSADNERLFSIAKLTVTDLRTRLGSKSMEALLCLKSWRRPQVVKATGKYIPVVDDDW